MQKRVNAAIAIAALVGLIPVAAVALSPYSQDFEGLDQTDITALDADGWIVYGNVYAPDGTTWLYGYGPFPAPNDGAAFCQIALGEGGVEQGAQQLNTFSDYLNLDHLNGNLVEANIFQELSINQSDVGETWVFDFEAKLGNLEGATTAAAFIKTIDPGNGYAMTNFISQDMTATPATWTGYSLSIEIIPELSGQLLQFGFLNVATDYEGSGVFYDNLDFHVFDPSGVPDGSAAMAATLGQNYPNPFNPLTRIDFALARPETVEIAIFDLAGRRIAVLQQGELAAGEHTVVWNGRTDSGSPAASGQYRYVLKTGTGQVARSMVLLK
jgi:hypothetical protein